MYAGINWQRIGLLALSTRNPGDYVTQMILRLSSDVDLDKFRAAWETVVGMLPILRTRLFFAQEFGIFQGVLNETVNWVAAADRDSYIRSDLARPMALGDPQTRYAIIGGASSHDRSFVWTIHHSLYDAWIMPRILEAVERAYQGMSLGPYQSFHTFIKYITELNKEEAREFWRSYLVNVPAQLPLGRTDCTDSGQRGFVQKDCHAMLSNMDHLPSVFIRAAMGITLAQFTGQQDVVFGSTVFGRNCPVNGGVEDVMVRNVLGHIIHFFKSSASRDGAGWHTFPKSS